MRNRLIRLCVAIACLYSSTSSIAMDNEIDSLLHDLDSSIKERLTYTEHKDQMLKEQRQHVIQTKNPEDKFNALGKLMDEYKSYNTDSAMHIANERYRLALKMRHHDHINDARMNIADIMIKTGMYKEALDSLHGIRSATLPDYLRPYYYHLYRTIYGLMSDYSLTRSEKENYAKITDRYRDSLLMVNAPESLTYTLVKSDQYNVHGEYNKALDLLHSYCDKHNNGDKHALAVCAYTLSESYRLKGDRKNEKKYLIISAASDMRSAVREYISLRNLAVLLYQEGDIERAYSYLKICMDDATACNARQRIIEILQVFPVINEAYHQQVESQQNKLEWSLLSISLLSLLLLVMAFLIYKQLKQVTKARSEQEIANARLKDAIEKLNRSNEELKNANYSIAENSYLKEEYIGRYMDQCSLYLEKIDNYRRSLMKMASKGKIDELVQSVRSRQFIDDELKEFYDNFDETFLQLFPTFVEDFNKLLADGEQIYPKANEKLNTELRIFALIRLGITNSVKIAQFLRYSVTTIYNYRTKIRNKAAGDRNALESSIMQIGKLQILPSDNKPDNNTPTVE